MAKIGLKPTPGLLILLLILGLAAFLRFYQLSDYMNFLGDEGRDALIVKEMLVDHNLPFIGPPTSVGNMYLGPLYYYMMAVPMAIWWLDPVAATGMNAAIGVATVGLIYWLSRRWFGGVAACVAAFLYAISPVTIIYSRSSWNPNPTPFFALLALLGVDQVRRTHNFYWFGLTGFSLAAALQMHYLALILLPVFGLLWLFELWRLKKKAVHYRHFWLGTIGAILVFGLLMSPLVLFDLKHDFLNSKSFLAILQGTGSGPVESGGFWERLWPIFNHNLIGRYMAGRDQVAALVVSILVLMPLGLALGKQVRRQVVNWPYFALGVWLTIGLCGIATYRGQVYDHYLGFLNPAPYLLLAGMVAKLARWRLVMAVGLVVVLGWLNLRINPQLSPPNRQLAKTQTVARFIVDQVGGAPYNFALLSKWNYDDAYQFFLERYGNASRMLPVDKTELLYVVCEEADCQPINSPQYEISAFGWSKIERVDEVAGVKVFKLVPNQVQ